MSDPNMSKTKRVIWLIVLIIPCLLSIWVPLYNRVEPMWFGIPFFYWFQFSLIIVMAIVTALAYRFGL